MTDQTWEQLAHCALENLSIVIAKKAFNRTRNTWLYLELIQNYLDETGVRNKSTELSFLGDVAAYKSHYNEAAKLYKQAGKCREHHYITHVS